MNVEREPGEPVSLLLLDRQIHAASRTCYTRIVRRLETHQAVQDLGTVELGFDPATQRLIVHGVSVFRAGNLNNHADEAAFELFQREATLEQDVLTGAVTALLLLKDIRVGDVLDIEFSIVSDSGLFGEHYWISESIEGFHPVGRQWLSWIEREGQSLFVREVSGRGTYERTTTEHGMVRCWSFERIPAVRLEPDIPMAYCPFEEISITTLSEWGEMVELFLSSWTKPPSDRTELDAELVELRKSFAADPWLGIAAAVDLVRHQIRYLGYSPGIMGLVPADPGEVWQRRFGDCKEKSRLLSWFLCELGVAAEPVLVHTEVGCLIHERQPSPGAFNHVVVRVRFDGIELWIDPTDVARQGSVKQWQSLPFHCGLPLSPHSRALVSIPVESAGLSGLEVEEILRVDSGTRGADVLISHTYRGRDADMVRHAMDSRGRTALAEYLTEQVKITRKDAQASSELEVSDDPVANLVVLRRSFRCEELLMDTQDGSASLVFLVPHSIPQRVTGVATTDRKHPLGIQHPVDVKHTIRLNSPDPRNIKIPSQIVKSEFFQFSFTTTTSRSESVHVFSYRSQAMSVPAAKVRGYAKDLNRMGEAFDWHIRFPPRKWSGLRSFSSRGPKIW